jgi:hypothetical protein
MNRFRFSPRQFWITALSAGGAGVAGSWLALNIDVDPMISGGIAAGVGGAIALRLQGIKPDAESGR